MFRPFGTLTLLSTLMCEVIRVLVISNAEEETWSWEARDILLDTWTALLVVYVFKSAVINICSFRKLCFHTICVKRGQGFHIFYFINKYPLFKDSG